MLNKFRCAISTTLAVLVACSFMLDMGEAHATNQSTTIVAVVDSGVDAGHRDLKGKLVPGFDLTNGNDPNADRVGHGTAMASLIAGDLSGACGHCKIMPLKITDSMTVDLGKVAAAIDIAVQEGVSLIYVGAGAVETDDSLTRAIENAHAAGVTIVAPVGTQGLAAPLYPAAFPSVIAVAALDRDGQLLNASNNPGNGSLFAMGQDVNVANVSGGYRRVSGSSPAAAVIAGQQAQAIDQHPRLAVTQRSLAIINHTVPGLESPLDPQLTARLQYADTDDTDIILDAPWRTIRDYLPFLVFIPEFEQTGNEKRTLQKIELHNYDRMSGAEKDLIFQDVPHGVDQTSCAGKKIEIIDSEGRARDTVGTDEPIVDFWHYIAKVPVDCIGVGSRKGVAGEHFLLARVYWTTVIKTEDKSITHNYNVHAVLRVLVGSNGFPRFDSADHYYDAHVHTIAEQTGWHGVTNVDAAAKAYGGPLAMLTESAYALGLIETRLKNGNWTAFRDQLATTDHNVFYSRNPYDAGTSPGYGPTANTKGNEFKWYRDHFGELSGEEVTLRGTGRTVHSDMTKAIGSHFLVYGGPHFEGPWHGGHFTADPDAEGLGFDLTTLTDQVGVKNPNELIPVLERLSHTDAFGYAAHPFSSASGWSKQYFEQAIGLPPHHNVGGKNSRILQKDARDFIFKGSQVWNEKHDFKSTAEMLGGHLAVRDLNHFDPFTPSGTSQRFVSNPSWVKDVNGAVGEYVGFLKQGLKYNFQQQPDSRFIRKLYMSAGTDAHGDFNYLTSLESTAVAEIYDYFNASVKSAAASSNAFGRVRTYTLSGEKQGRFLQPQRTTGAFNASRTRTAQVALAGTGSQVAIDDSRPGGGSITTVSALRASVSAYREGNTILTDGPICKFSVDSECRFDSNTENPQWHDGLCAWENADGRIGGEGDFDGGGSALISRGSNALLSTLWDGRNDYIPIVNGQPDNIEFTLSAHYSNGPSVAKVMDGGPRGQVQYVALAPDMMQGITEHRDYSPSALMLRGDLGSAESGAACITNPVWAIPVKFSYPAAPSECSIKPGELRVSISFGVSMDSTLSDRCAGGNCLAPAAGGQANYQGPTIKVYPLDGSGQSIGNGVSLKPRWFANNLSGPGFKKIADANLVGDNKSEIACPGADWDANSHTRKRNVRSYAVIVSNLRDMHGNELNAIADTFTLKKASVNRVPPSPAGNTGTVFDPGKGGRRPKPNLSCGAASTNLCKGYGASCEVVTATNGKRSDLCRWSARNSAGACERRTAGIWTKAGSRYAKNHPGAVQPGTAGACITEVKNLKNRIQ